ncbi:hypothetical protein GCM10010946_34680 [Undibacterium squillarum]|uniref:HTH cro/C1-type domain-containing protein n=2 Tax=Undibacterium squillarum TaxID=1131567 RepID=A0ABQ2Y4M5_9BURK|nr:hypothetical protein GCM10010946_34680 [Undibacterium squillarum]
MRIAHIKSQAELHRLSGIPATSIARILKGQATPSIENLAKIAQACKTTTDALIFGTHGSSKEITHFPLIYVTQRELTILHQYRQANSMGKTLIETAAETAEKAPSTLA